MSDGHGPTRGGSFPRYLVVGVFTSLLDFSVFTILAVPVGVSPVVSNVVSTAVTICVSYIINRRWVFRAQRATWASFFSFASVSLITGMLIQSAVIWMVVHAGTTFATGLDPAMIKTGAKIIAMGVGAMCNYLGYRTVFRRSDAQSGAPTAP